MGKFESAFKLDDRVGLHSAMKELHSHCGENLRKASAGDLDSQTLRGRLETIRRLIGADTPYRVYYTDLGGFDTHAGQEFAHQALLAELSQAIAGFLRNLKAARLDRRVLVLAYSEFGRRLDENASGGTDHGTAAPTLIAGPAVKGGLLGTAPDLKNLDDAGDPRFTTDFRDIYAKLLKTWLKIDPTPILGERKPALEIV
jgi:uncharacterized protein (DUF1501 family)